MPLYNGFLVQFQKCSGDVLEDWQMQQLGGIEYLPFNLRSDYTLVGERAGGT